jgi:uncharacterized glyoxalase superfamily protein PhnB
VASTPKSPPIPDRYRRVTPALVADGAAKVLEFYADVYGATERMRVPGPDGTIAHAEIEIGDSVVMVEDASPYMGTHRPPCSSTSTTDHEVARAGISVASARVQARALLSARPDDPRRRCSEHGSRAA